MEDPTKSSIDASSSDIDAGGDVKFIGGSEYNIAGHVFNIDVATPSYGAKIESLQKALEVNRISLKDDLLDLEKKVRKGLRLTHGEIRALTKDIITSGKNVELLIPAIKMNGGKAKSLPFESDIISRINNSIMKGQKVFKEKELVNLIEELPEAKKQLRGAERWQFLRPPERRIEEVNEATIRVEKIERGIERARNFLEHCKRIMKYDEPKIPSTDTSKPKIVKPKKILKTVKPKPETKAKETKPRLRGTMMKKKKKS